jgi:uncharacterized protein (DUF58 family)
VFTRAGWGLVATTAVLVVVAAWWHEPPLWALATAGVVALGVATGWRLTGANLSLDRHLVRDRVTVGDEVSAELFVANQSRRSSGPLVGREGFGTTTFQVELPSVAAGARVELEYQLPTERRGVVRLGPFVIDRTDPLALASRTQRHLGAETLWIHPRVHAVAPLAAGLRPTPEGLAHTVSPQATLAFHSLREYVVGDDLRQIHWRSTAHTGTLMVRHNLDASVPSGVVVLDTRRWVHQPDSFEEAVEVAASLVLASSRAHLPIRLLTTGGLHLDDHRAGPDAFLDQLAGVQLDDHGRLVDVGRHLPRRRHGVALAVVTGVTRAEDLAALAQLCHGFSEATVVRVRPGPGAPVGAGLPGLGVIDVDAATEFAARWGTARR